MTCSGTFTRRANDGLVQHSGILCADVDAIPPTRLVESTILYPEGSPGWAGDPGKLWNKVEAGEKRQDAQLAREFVLAVPVELSSSEQFQLAVEWSQKELVAKGMVAEVSLHHPKSRTNPHVHVLCTMRKFDGEKFSEKKSREWNDVALLAHQRESWAEAVNAALEKAGRTERVDHRSLKDRGIDRLPEPKIGVAATAMKRRGVLPDPERFRVVRWVKSLNEVRQAARETVMDTWRMLLASRSPGHDNGPTPQKGPDISR